LIEAKVGLVWWWCCCGRHVADINANITKLPSLGPYSKYSVPEENITGRLELKWVGGFDNGIAVTLDSEGIHVSGWCVCVLLLRGASRLTDVLMQALKESTAEVLGHVKPYAITGSLPLVRYLQEHGFDVQLCGYGLSSK
jgi:acetylornithine deacetylase